MDFYSQINEERVESILQQLTLEEKFLLSAGADNWHTAAIPRLNIPAFAMTDGPHGVRPQSSGGKQTTYFPTSICMGATWNPDLAREFGQALAEEVRAVGSHMILGPGINIIRTPLNGRNFEYLSEDPCLVQNLVVPIVEGIQSKRIAACVKHFICNNQETNRFSVNAVVSAQALHDLYFPGFKAAVTKAHPMSLMGCYNRVNGIYGCAHKELITETAMNQWRFKGFVVSDWGATKPVWNPQKLVDAGLSLEMGRPIRFHPNKLRKLEQKHRLDHAKFDDNIRRLLRAMDFVGLFDDKADLPKGALNTPEHFQIARRIAEEGIVLLKNDGLLPLSSETTKKIVILGPNRNKKMAFGGGSSEINPLYEITLLEGLRNKIQSLEDQTSRIVLSEHWEDVQGADLVIYVGGLNHDRNQDSEGRDRKDMHMPFDQVQAIIRLGDLTQKLLVCLVNGGPVEMGSWLPSTYAVLELWYAGMEGGNAFADIIFGDVNPSGKLPYTIPRILSDCSAHVSKQTYPGKWHKALYSENIFVGYRHFDHAQIAPQFPFGFGLSYSQFELRHAQISVNSLKIMDIISMHEEDLLPFTITCQLSNQSSYAGKEVVQLYLSKPSSPESDFDRAEKELKSFQKIMVPAEETVDLSFNLPVNAFYSFMGKNSEGKPHWNVIAGQYEILLGTSSRHIHQKLSLILD